MSVEGSSVVAPGNYDGVHVGHRALVDAARELAEDGERVTVLTFDPHPARVLAPLRAPELLTTVARRKALLLGAGADLVRVQRFDRAFASRAPMAFIEELLRAELRATGVIVGADFRFGKDRAGGVQTLREAGLRVRLVDAVERGGSVVSSTRIRACVRDGRVEEATRLLTRVHDVGGTVVEGFRRGRTIGFPTANLDAEPVLLPADGVYSVVARVGGELLKGVANLGVRPTVDAGRSVEAHFLDFDGDLYGQEIRLGFVTRLRDEMKFDGLPALKAQIAADVVRARADFAAADERTWSWV